MKLFKLTIFLIFLILNNTLNSLAAEVSGAADIYKVKMHKLELCTGHTAGDFDDTSTSTTQCQNAVIIGNDSDGVEVDIASVTAGAVAGAFGNVALLPLGETYTHARVHINRLMKIRTASAINTTEDADTDNCMTITTTNGMYQTNEATDKYTHKPAVPENGSSGVSQEMNLYMTNGRQGGAGGGSETYTQCEDATCGEKNTSAVWNYPADTSSLTSAKAMQTMRDGSTDQVALIYALSAPYTVSLISPTIDMAFGTSKAIQAEEVTDGSDFFCRFAIQEPTVTISIK